MIFSSSSLASRWFQALASLGLPGGEDCQDVQTASFTQSQYHFDSALASIGLPEENRAHEAVDCSTSLHPELGHSATSGFLSVPEQAGGIRLRGLGDSRAGVLAAVQSTEAISSRCVAVILPVNKLSLTPPPERAQVDPEGPPAVDALMTQLQANLTWRKAKRITAVAAYEDASSEPRVGEFCLNLARQLGKSPELSKVMWLFSELRPG